MAFMSMPIGGYFVTESAYRAGAISRASMRRREAGARPLAIEIAEGETRQVDRGTARRFPDRTTMVAIADRGYPVAGQTDRGAREGQRAARFNGDRGRAATPGASRSVRDQAPAISSRKACCLSWADKHWRWSAGRERGRKGPPLGVHHKICRAPLSLIGTSRVA
jgi:hypothetical protein